MGVCGGELGLRGADQRTNPGAEQPIESMQELLSCDCPGSLITRSIHAGPQPGPATLASTVVMGTSERVRVRLALIRWQNLDELTCDLDGPAQPPLVTEQEQHARPCNISLGLGEEWAEAPPTPTSAQLLEAGFGLAGCVGELPLPVRTPPGLLMRDGMHLVSALCTLRVAIITDDMLTNSITVRLENMSQERFLSPLLGLFAEGVAAVLSTSRDGVFVFNVQNDSDVSGRILNVTFSALLPGGAPGRYFPSEELQEQIYLNRTLLRRISSQSVLPFDDNICLREPCENYMKCVSVLKFDSSPPFVASDTVLFRPIHPVNGLRCRCPPGFTGDYCETEVDLCYSGPCRNNGRCRSHEGGYTCECLEDFTGDHCEVNSRSGRCMPGVCKNGGKCVDLLVGGFMCQCLPGEYEKPYCEMTTRSFPARSFVTFRGLRQRFHFTVSLIPPTGAEQLPVLLPSLSPLLLLIHDAEFVFPLTLAFLASGNIGTIRGNRFATRERNALLLYNGRFNEKHDFIAMEIIDEQIQLTFSAGETKTTVAPFVPGGVSNGQWHSVQLHYYNKAQNVRTYVPFIGPGLFGVPECKRTQAVKGGNEPMAADHHARTAGVASSARACRVAAHGDGEARRSAVTAHGSSACRQPGPLLRRRELGGMFC
ncbi:hypothetical protein P4O66_002329 [Electrophorus voltai]|uniref:EGF-like domain-containing protein n=1 Tax=Electrophorus voltai TaxID=2609070 RepID=A0AAD8Z1Z6_9TELE|nr:hypothetical protein P4O66_002329 [Electrophorus voltai]